MDEANPAPGSSTAARKSQVTSCAECRRLKLRCDRVFPCSSCIRRGCANLCPTGTLEKGKRGFLKRLEQSLPSAYPKVGGEIEHSEVAMFVARDAAMTKRIQELEAALTVAGISIPAPALVPESSSSLSQDNGEGRAKRPRTESSTSDPPATENDCAAMPVDTTDVTLGFGTLTIDVENRSRYVGPSGGAAYLNTDLWTGNAGQTQSRKDSQDSGMPPAAVSKTISDDSSPESISRTLRKGIALWRPKYCQKWAVSLHTPRRSALRTYISRMFHLCTRLFPKTFSSRSIYQLYTQTERTRTCPRTCMYSRWLPWFFLSFDTIPGVQTLHLMALYFLSTKGESGGDSAWQLLGIAMRSIQAQGCHRDGSRWGLPQRELEERRRVFWETHMYDRLQSFTFGRPYAQGDAHHDCEMPQSCDTPLPSDTDPSNSAFSHTRWHYHKFRFAILLGRIVDLAFSVNHPAYSVIMELDREIHDHYDALPGWIICDAVENPVKELPVHAMAGDAELRRNAQRASLANMYFLTLLHLHRGPFCRALMLEPKNLTNSRYAASITSLTGAARGIINIARGLFALHPGITSRMWYWLFHSFTAAVCQAVLVIVAPSHPLSPAAFESMKAALELFERADGDRAKSAAVRVGWLAVRASQAMEAFKNAMMQPAPAGDGSQAPIKLQFPTSNMRGNPEDLLGTSTKLIRAQPGDDLSSPSPLSSVSSQMHPSPISNTSSAAFQFGQPTRGLPDAAHPPRAGGVQNNWLPPGRNDVAWTGNFTYSTMPQNPQPPPTNDMQPQPHPVPPFLDPSLYLSPDGFDLSGFIQNGANAWLFDRAPELDSESSWPDHMQ